MGYTVNQVACLAGVTSRTLRYYDQTGLLHPSGRTEAGYRLYSSADVERLQQILFFRELDFPLAEIAAMLDNTEFDRRKALQMQGESLKEKARRYQQLSQLALKTLKDLEGGKKMTDKDLFEGFDYDKLMENQQRHQNEVQERWGETQAYRMSTVRTASYTREDWERIHNRQMRNVKDLCELYRAGVPCEDARVQEVVHRARQFISDNFYECTLEIWSGLGQMYVSDERFSEYYNKHVPGLAAYFNDAIQFYCSQK